MTTPPVTDTSVRDARLRWQNSTPADVDEAFQRIIASLEATEHGHLAARQFTIFLRHTALIGSRPRAGLSATIYGEPVRTTLLPIGTALIVSAPLCDAFTVIKNVAAALVARNCVELALFDQPPPDVAALITALQQVLPPGVFTVRREPFGWGERGESTAVIILTPDQWFTTSRGRVRSGVPVSPQAMVAFYSR